MNTIALLCAVVLLINLKWIFILLMIPLMAMDKYRDKGTIGKRASMPYRICERVFRGVMRFCIQHRNNTLK